MTGWALAGQVAYITLVALAVWCAVALLIAIGWHLVRRRDHRP